MSSSPSRVLVLDDDAALARALCRALSVERRGVMVATCCAQAREIVLSAPVQLLVADLELPDGSGAALAAELLASRRTARVIFFTGGASDEVFRAATQLGPVVSKPDVAALLRQVCGAGL